MGKNKNQVNVKFTDEQRKIISKLIGVMGGTDAEVVRSIFLSWLSEKNIIQDYIKSRGKNNG